MKHRVWIAFILSFLLAACSQNEIPGPTPQPVTTDPVAQSPLAAWIHTALPTALRNGNDAPLFAVSPNQLLSGATTTLFWRVPDCDRVTISDRGGVILFDKRGVCTYYLSQNPQKDNVYTIKAWDVRSRLLLEKSLHVTIVQPAPPPAEIVKFTVLPYSISKGQTSVMTWKVKNAVRVEILTDNGGSMGIPPTQFEGSMVISPPTSTMYSLNAFGSDGKIVTSKAHLEIDTPLFPPRITQWSAANSNLFWGESTVLTWRVSPDAVKVEMEDPRFGLWPLPSNAGSITVTPDRTSNYVINASSKEGVSSSQSLTLNVIERVPQIESFSSAAAEIEQGQKTTLSWKVLFATKVSITSSDNQVFDNLALSGQQTISPSRSTTYQIQAYDRLGIPITREVNVQVVPPERQPVIEMFTASSLDITEGDAPTLSWRVSDCGKVIVSGPFIAQGAAEMPCNGYMPVGPKVPQGYYTLQAYSTKGRFQASANLTIHVRPRPLNPVIISFYGSPSAVFPGEGVTIMWQVNDCDHVFVSGLGINGGRFGCIGSQAVYPYGNSQYTLTAIGLNGNLTATQTITIIVNERPQPPYNPGPHYPGPYYPGPHYPGPYYPGPNHPEPHRPGPRRPGGPHRPHRP